MKSYPYSEILAVAVGLVALAFTPSASAATILTFRDAAGDSLPNDELVPQTYGDNVAASPQDGFSYGQAGSDYTPNITITYSDNIFTYAEIEYGAYGDLETVLYSENPFTITFTAADGLLVSLESFKVATFGGVDEIFDVTISNGVSEPFTLTGASSPVLGNNNIDFTGQAAAIGQIVTLTFNVPNFNVGVSDIQFSQVGSTPQPPSKFAATIARNSELTQATITWNSEAGEVFDVFRSVDLNFSAPAIATDLIGAAGFTNYVDTSLPAGGKAFYQVSRK